ncbi:MAG: hypothetical protein J6Z11_04900 [Candidatus Riflebacteria bacterium]|nr:hypothetical protein [Candidatus Riflebacteria bacterium]
MSQVKLEQIITPAKTSPESEENALVAIDTQGLNADSLEILNQIIAEQDTEKSKDLTYLFNQNQNKKTMVRLDSLSLLQDKLVGLLSKRVTERPDEMSNQEVMQALKIVQDIIDRSTKQVNGGNEKPLIQINQQTNNIGSEQQGGLSRDSRDKVKNAVMSILNSIKDATVDEPEVVDFTEDSDND